MLSLLVRRAETATTAALVLTLLPALAQAQQERIAANFNSQFLRGNAQHVDLTHYQRGNPVLAGDYYLDVYVNGRWQGRNLLAFRVPAAQVQAQTCFERDTLLNYGVDPAALASAETDVCQPLTSWLPDARTEFDSSRLRLDLHVPQAQMSRNPRGYVAPDQWDPGINAGFLSYNINAFHSERIGTDMRSRRDSVYGMFNAGVNLGPWQLRHDSSVQAISGESSHWQRTATYLRRPLPSIQGVLTLGESYTDGQLFDSVGYRGVSLVSDDRMLPDSQRGYAPVVRGLADTNALVEIRQNGQVIYQSTVPPGPFVVDDLYATGYGGDLEVMVREADGRVQRFVVPYASVPQMLRDGQSRYQFTTGTVRESQLSRSPWMAQGTYQYGLSNRLTAYSGGTASDDYFSWLGGAALGTPIGAFSFDITHATSRFERHANRSGQSYKLGYSKLLPEMGTNITVAAYRYSTAGYLSFRDALSAMELERNQLSLDALRRQRSEFQLTLNQNLGGRRGALYVTGSVRDYWRERGRATQYQFGYNNRYENISYSVSVQQTEYQLGERDTLYSFTMSVPLDYVRSRPTLSTSLTQRDSDYDSGRLGLSGSALHNQNLNYNVTVADSRGSATTAELSAEYRAPYASLRASHSQSTEYRQTSAGVSGSLVGHAGGITLAPQRGDTMVLIEAPDAKGAEVLNAQGVTVDRHGYALVPYVSPYRLNTVTLEPGNMSHQVELRTNQQVVAPYAGAVARLRFDTRSGQPLLLKVRMADGKPVPFGAQVSDSEGQPVGLVGQGGVVFLRTDAAEGRLQVNWGAAADSQCHLHFQMPTGEAGHNAFQRQETVCE